jgi:DNA-binding CsgD family transcriptional regulator
MRSSRTVDYCEVLELVAEALRCAGPDFPGRPLTESLRQLFQAEFAGAGVVDLSGTASRHWAGAPRPIEVSPGYFHGYAITHPITRAYQRTGDPIPLRTSDVAAAGDAPPGYGGTNLSRVLTIPLAIAPQRLSSIALMRSGSDFTPGDVQLASQLQPILGGVYALRARAIANRPGRRVIEPSVDITPREFAVMQLMISSLTTTAIARRLGISPRTVGTHIEVISENFSRGICARIG